MSKVGQAGKGETSSPVLSKHNDHQYLSIVRDILKNGTPSDDRTGVGTLSLFGATQRFNCSGDILPIIATRRVSARIAFEELMFMLNGKHQTKELEEKKVNIWKGNTSREFLDARGLTGLEEGDFGRMYGVQLRSFIGEEYWNEFDQLEYMVDAIKKKIADPNCSEGRRIIATHYNPADADQGALFPCHIMTQFNVRGGKLDCLFWMRSSDVGYGLPYNLMYYSMFTKIMAKLTGLEAGDLIYQAGDCHLYKDQVESGMLHYMIDNFNEHRGNYVDPKFVIKKDVNTLEDMLQLTWEDVEVIDYQPYKDFEDKPPMAI